MPGSAVAAAEESGQQLWPPRATLPCVARLSSIDAFWINAEGDGPPFAIGALVVVDGPAPTLAELRTFIAARLPVTPRLRERLVPDPVGLRQPRWEPTEPDLGHHVTTLALVEGDQADLEQAVARIMQVRMDEDRPLWDYTLLTGLADGRWAVVSRVHHSVADGQGALLLTGHLIDVDEAGTTSLTAAVESLLPAAPEHPPASRSEALAQGVKQGGDLALRAIRTLRSASATGEAFNAATRRAATVGTQLPKEAGPLAGDPGEHRVWHTTTVSLDDVRTIRRGLGGTVNDVVMTLMSGGYRALLTSWGTDPEGERIRVLVPVSLRSPGNLAANNQVGALLVMLPLAGETAARYDDVRAHLDEVKNLGTAPLATPVYEAIDRTVPAVVQTFAVSALSGTVGGAFVETLVTNVPGPQFPLYVMGRRAHTMAPLIPLGEPLRLNVGVVSYDGILHFGITGGEGIGDGVYQVGAGIQQALRDLLAAAATAAADPR